MPTVDLDKSTGMRPNCALTVVGVVAWSSLHESEPMSPHLCGSTHLRHLHKWSGTGEDSTPPRREHGTQSPRRRSGGQRTQAYGGSLL